MSAPTPEPDTRAETLGRIAYEAYWRYAADEFGADPDDPAPGVDTWDQLADWKKRAIEAGVRPAAAAPAEPRPAPAMIEVSGSVVRVIGPAPELAAAMAEARAAKGAVNEMMRMFHGIPGGYGARTSIVRLRRIAETAGVTPPQPGDPLSAVVADELAVLQDHIGTLAAGLKLSASSSHPSKKSEIETGVADALLALLDPR